MRTIQFFNGEIYHIYNRGVDKKIIFENDSDRLRFIHNLFEFNDTAPAFNLGRRISKAEFLALKKERPKRELLVEILAFCMMPDHYHLLIKQLRRGGITKFLHKLGTGYTLYFNKTRKRKGSLFESRFKAVPVIKENHLFHLFYYIHLNPLDLIEPEWRRGEIKNSSQAIDFLLNYRWSSLLDYLGKKNFPSLTQRDLLSKFVNGKDLKENIKKWLQKMEIDQIIPLLLEPPITD